MIKQLFLWKKMSREHLRFPSFLICRSDLVWNIHGIMLLNVAHCFAMIFITDCIVVHDVQQNVLYSLFKTECWITNVLPAYEFSLVV